MKTNELINALAADAASKEPPIGLTIVALLAAGIAASIVVLFGYLGVRTDLAAAAAYSWHLPMKFAFTALLAIPAYLIVQRLARPDGEASALWPLLAAAPVLLLTGVVYDFATGALYAPASEVIMAPNWSVCVLYIPLLSLAPLAATLFALKQGAPANPALAGAIGGLMSGALGATLYGTYCDADSPLFVAVWYPLGIAAITALGGAIGAKLLKW